jgi:hypothetical protein
MGLFGDKSEKNKAAIVTSDKENKQLVTERPRICCIDLSDEIIEALRKIGANIYKGTLGDKIKVPNINRGSARQLLLSFDFPKNLHEYDIIIIDLNNFKIVDYKQQDHTRTMHTGKTSVSLLSSFPETLFDPRPMGSFILRNLIHEITNREFLVLAFSSASYDIDYEPIEINDGGYSERQGLQKYNIYSFWDYVPTSTPKYGKELILEPGIAELQPILGKYQEGSVYNQTFHHPTTWTNQGSVEDDRYTPLFKNLNGDIVSYSESSENRNLILLPQLQDKCNFILDFLSKAGPSLYPSLFPYSTTFNWKKEQDYWLPNHSDLLKEKDAIEEEFKRKNEELEKRISDNENKFSFLHEIISETGDNLTNALVKYLKWLEFKNVEKYDKRNESTGALEEDIQVKMDDGLLITECKGIGGTSTDADCSQISKIKHRRSKERGKFDVSALYIVNHQRHLPPLKRQNPPFTEHQKQDAINDARGLLSTWQLFNLYFDIQNGIISKQNARKLILSHGLIEFRPIGLTYVDEPKEIFNEGKVCIVNIDNVTIKTNDELLVEKNGKFEKALIIDIQDNGKSIQQVSKGEYGLKLDKRIAKKSILWTKGGS